MPTPKISILIVTYNRANYLKAAIDSVFPQTFADWELIIVDGGSTDNTAQLVENYRNKDQRVRFLPQSIKGGVAHDRNVGLNTAQGKYIAILDSDDIWADPTKLQKQYEFLETHQKDNYVLVGSAVIEIDKDSYERKRYLNALSDQEIRKQILNRNPFAHSSVLFLRSAITKVGNYDEKYIIGEDYDLILRLGLIGKMANLPDHFLKYRIHPQSACVADRIGGAWDTQKIIKQYKNKYPGYRFAILKSYLRILFNTGLLIKDKLWRIRINQYCIFLLNKIHFLYRRLK